MSDDLAIIIIVAITAAIIFLYYIISKTIARFIFKHLSPTTKNRITKYYRVNFFSTLINGAIAGLCVWPFYYLYLIPHFDYVFNPICVASYLYFLRNVWYSVLVFFRHCNVCRQNDFQIECRFEYKHRNEFHKSVFLFICVDFVRCVDHITIISRH